MAFLEKLGAIIDAYQKMTNEEFEVEHGGRKFRMNVRGRVHSLDELWVYDVTATDLHTGVSEQVKHFERRDDGVQAAIRAVLKILEDRGLVGSAGGVAQRGAGIPLPASSSPLSTIADNQANHRQATSDKLFQTLLNKGLISENDVKPRPSPSSPPPPPSNQNHPVQTTTATGQRPGNRIEIEPDVDGLYTNTILPAATPLPSDLDNENMYVTWTSSYKGVAYILNNSNFPHLPKDSRGMRRGSEIDVRNVEHVFSQLGYEPLVYCNLTRDEILSSIEETVQKINAEGERHSSACFVLMSHGNEHGVSGTDASPYDQRIVSRDEIKDRLTGRRCRALLGKPKLIFIQACRGNQFTLNAEELDALMSSAKTRREESDFEVDFVPSFRPAPSLTLNLDASRVVNDFDVDGGGELPNNADMFVANATSNGYYSIRMRHDGSWFVQALAEVFLANAHVDELHELMRKVTRLVTEHFQYTHEPLEAGARSFQVRQTPAYESQGMRKRFYFFPKYPPQ
ncbi:cell death protein 3-like [Diadema setosum]|uniref:cell death protein 3-like n=1 Tax=Diadema setosum TaxID=31175 RepID=UPI003B3B6A31